MLCLKRTDKITGYFKREHPFVDLNKYKAEQPQNLRGNSLEISDESDFLATEKTKANQATKYRNGGKKCPISRKKYFKTKLRKL